MPRSSEHYSTHAARLAERYESIPFEQVHAPWLHLLPMSGGRALDIGAGSGRDAAALADRGFEVMAVEPAEGLRAEAARRHPSPAIEWLDDSLPHLSRITETHGSPFDLVLVSAVWLHVRPTDRSAAMHAVVHMLEPAGLLIVTLRHGPMEDPRPEVYETSADELTLIAEQAGLEAVPLADESSADHLNRPVVRWTTHAFRAPAAADSVS